MLSFHQKQCPDQTVDLTVAKKEQLFELQA